MVWHWKEVVPSDSYRVRLQSAPNELDLKVLTLLYQPLIGAGAVSLYTTLRTKLERDQYVTAGATHRELMISTGISLNDIVDERKKLEAVGLLQTRMKQSNDGRDFLYELDAPMSPARFFYDDVLNVFLYKRVGKGHYLQLRQRFLTPQEDEAGYEDVTAAFDEVFTSLQASELTMAETPDDQAAVAYPDDARGVRFRDQFDYELLKASMPPQFAEGQLENLELEHLIRRLAFVYKLDPLQMSRMVLEAADVEGTVSFDHLREAVQNWYRSNISKEAPALAYKSAVPAEEQVASPQQTARSPHEEQVHYYETAAPADILQGAAEGAHVPFADLKLVETLIFEYKLPQGVVNVLIDYVMRTNEKKLNAGLVEKIAGHWSRLQLQTVEEAMAHAKKEHQRRKEQKSHESSTKNANRAKQRYNQREEQLPKWLIEEEKQKEAAEDKQEVSEDKEKLAREKQEEFERLLKEGRSE
ncbi:replicative DNA helicase loader DnaB [Salsuginibacillus halophilus]|uniref:Replicative DNA helicase loader DnaB n=1 Tax=Salsuginibacillus halophilus TaxID=517424 RepID=A0A2P8HCV0_9BACI|nr:DnaD domain protein [Salsuginibacillus halophilus]PSL44060.1 replicative DNA helicase loader DnaB [Salsuginibacillus halophilus]